MSVGIDEIRREILKIEALPEKEKQEVFKEAFYCLMWRSANVLDDNILEFKKETFDKYSKGALSRLIL